MAIAQETYELLLHAAELRAAGNSWQRAAETIGISPGRLRVLVAENTREYDRHARRARTQFRLDSVGTAMSGLTTAMNLSIAKLSEPRATDEKNSPETESHQKFHLRIVQMCGVAMLCFEIARRRRSRAAGSNPSSAVRAFAQAQKLVDNWSESTQDLTDEELAVLRDQKDGCACPHRLSGPR